MRGIQVWDTVRGADLLYLSARILWAVRPPAFYRCRDPASVTAACYDVLRQATSHARTGTVLLAQGLESRGVVHEIRTNSARNGQNAEQMQRQRTGFRVSDALATSVVGPGLREGAQILKR